MADGKTKNVEEIIKGDSLWSYDLGDGMEIHPNIVTHTATRSAEVWEIRFGNHSHGRLLLTAEHPVLTKDGWRPASELKVGDKILRVWNQVTESRLVKQAEAMKTRRFVCGKCGESLDGMVEWNRHRGRCYTKGLVKSQELRARYSQRMEHNPMSDPSVAARAIASSKARYLVDPTHGWNRNVERMRRWLHERPSNSQLLLYALLDEIGVQYEREYRILVKVRSASSRPSYIADAALLAAKLDIEVDGWWHFNNDDVKASDIVRNETLKANGWETLRISGSCLHNHPDEVKKLILERLAKPPMQNMRYWVQVKSVKPTGRAETVYGLETIPDHNYVADGILVHNCRYCQNSEISQRRKVEGEELSPAQVADLAAGYGCQGMAYTYNEPSIFIEYARDVGRVAHEKGIFNIFVSNGYDTPEAVDAMGQFLDCLTVDFKGSGETGFVRKFIGIPNAEPIFQTLLQVKEKTRIHTEITDLIVPGVGDDLESARKLASWVYDKLGPDTPIHFLRFHPDYKMMDIPVTPVKTLEAHHRVAREAGLRYVYIGNVPGHPAENTYCPGCGKVLIERSGYSIGAYNLDAKNRCKDCGYQTPVVGPLSSSANETRFVPVIN
ncbi:MAG: AmmeMemoRadiSam system radical SAM enzyme [Thaumarchaeota archaeon]|nr:AmmeMemoRadiSam system radical SAM enzyme [Nitrososphaerota archaeon]